MTCAVGMCFSSPSRVLVRHVEPGGGIVGLGECYACDSVSVT